MNASRPQPFELLFGAFRAERFPAIRDVLGERRDLAAFLFAAPALELLRELRPDEGLGEGVDDFVALVHAAYCFWCSGERTHEFDETRTRLLAVNANDRPLSRAQTSGQGETRYLQVAPRLIWGQLDPEAAFEPLDGWFGWQVENGDLRMVSCFGVHEQRPGVSVVVMQGPPVGNVTRADGSPLFSPTMPGGDAAELLAVNAPEELLLLGWRALAEGDASQWR
jgi:hypothetical protein